MNIPKYLEMYRKDLTVKNYSENTISNYVSQINGFLTHFNSTFSEPIKINVEAIKDWLLLSNSTNGRKHRLSALKLFYRLTINQPIKLNKIEYPKSEKKLPKVIDTESIINKLDNIQNLKHKAILTLTFSVGLRVSEVTNLKIEDIDSKRMLLHIKNAKGRKDRIVPLSNNVLILLREYFKKYRPTTYLFNGQNSEKYSIKSCQTIYKKYIDPKSSIHCLRHSSFTSMLESGMDLRTIQVVAGHANSKTTEVYTHVSIKSLNKINLPI